MIKKIKSLIETNPYLKDPIQRKVLVKRSVETSGTVEGIKVKKQSVKKFNPNSGDQLSQLLFNILKLESKEEWRRDKKPDFFSVKEDVLQELLGVCNGDAHRIIELILQTRGLKKQISTYFDGIEELTYACDSCVHQQFNHSATDTGRLSCKAPNTQNIPNQQNILEFFVSRY